jgi:hypothetical protein
MFNKVKEYMKMTSEQWYKKVAHLIFFWVSILFTIILFRSFTDEAFMKEVWTIFAIALELLKNYLIREIKTKYKSSHWFIVSSFALIYFVTALISGIATYGTVKITLDEQSQHTEILNKDTEVIQENIEVVDTVLNSLVGSIEASTVEKQKMSGMDGAFYSGQNKIAEEQDSSLDNVKEFLNMRTEMANSLGEEDQNIQTSGSDVFVLIGEDIGLTGQETLFWIFMILIVVLEAALFFTSDPFKYSIVEEPQELSEKEVVFNYIEALLNTSSAILVGDSKISEATGISKADCRRYRTLLSSDELKYRKRNLIYKAGSGWRANFNAATFKAKIEEYFEGVG